MSFFDSARDFLNGHSNSLKKEYSPFLSSALLHMPNFKIEVLEDSSVNSSVSTNEGIFTIYLSINKNTKKINELYTQIFDYLTPEISKQIESYKKIDEFLSFEEFKKLKNISKQSFSNIQNKNKGSFLVDHYLDLKSKRSYIRYLNEPENKKKIIAYKSIIYSEEMKFQKQKYNIYDNILNMDNKYYLDCNFKNVDPLQRKINSGSPTINNIMEQSKYKSRNKYRYLDVWSLSLTVIKNNEIIFEDVVLTEGNDPSSRKLHEDDFINISENIENMFERWNFFKYNYL